MVNSAYLCCQSNYSFVVPGKPPKETPSIANSPQKSRNFISGLLQKLSLHIFSHGIWDHDQIYYKEVICLRYNPLTMGKFDWPDRDEPRLPAQWAVVDHCNGPGRMKKVTSWMNWPIRNSTQIRNEIYLIDFTIMWSPSLLCISDRFLRTQNNFGP